MFKSMSFLSARQLILIFACLCSTHLLAQSLPDFTELVEKSAPAIVNVAIRSTVNAEQNLQDFEGNIA